MSTNTDPFHIAVLISGSGTNLQALIDATDPKQPERQLPNARITHVISNRKNAFGLDRAKEAGIDATYHNLVAYKKKQDDTVEGAMKAREAYDDDLTKIIINHNPTPDLVVCAGWMHILSSGFIDAFKDVKIPIINLHPAMPGQFNGADAIRRAYDAYQRGEIVNTGVMVHHVISEVDMGEPILVQDIECFVGESENDLEERIHKTEWKIIVDATAKVLKEIEEKRKQS